MIYKINLGKNNFSYLENKVLERLIHTSGDFTIEHLLNLVKMPVKKQLNHCKRVHQYLLILIWQQQQLNQWLKIQLVIKYFQKVTNDNDLGGKTKTARD